MKIINSACSPFPHFHNRRFYFPLFLLLLLLLLITILVRSIRTKCACIRSICRERARLRPCMVCGVPLHGALGIGKMEHWQSGKILLPLDMALATKRGTPRLAAPCLCRTSLSCWGRVGCWMAHATLHQRSIASPDITDRGEPGANQPIMPPVLLHSQLQAGRGGRRCASMPRTNLNLFSPICFCASLVVRIAWGLCPTT